MFLQLKTQDAGQCHKKMHL